MRLPTNPEAQVGGHGPSVFGDREGEDEPRAVARAGAVEAREGDEVLLALQGPVHVEPGGHGRVREVRPRRRFLALRFLLVRGIFMCTAYNLQSIFLENTYG